MFIFNSLMLFSLNLCPWNFCSWYVKWISTSWIWVIFSLCFNRYFHMFSNLLTNNRWSLCINHRLCGWLHHLLNCKCNFMLWCLKLCILNLNFMLKLFLLLRHLLNCFMQFINSLNQLLNFWNQYSLIRLLKTLWKELFWW